jgi:hypothetical protein
LGFRPKIKADQKGRPFSLQKEDRLVFLSCDIKNTMGKATSKQVFKQYTLSRRMFELDPIMFLFDLKKA